MNCLNIYGIKNTDINEYEAIFSARTHKVASAQFLNFLSHLPALSDSDDYELFFLGDTYMLNDCKEPEHINVDSYDFHAFEHVSKKESEE